MFLARSQHRIALLRGLSEEEQTRQDIKTTVGIPQPTLGRILGDFEDRNWVSNNHNGGYALTPVGSLLAHELEDLLTVLTSSERLANLSESLPLDRLGFDIRHLASVEVVEPSESDPLAHMRQFDELAAKADEVQVISNVLACAPGSDAAEAHEEFLTHLDEFIVTSEGFETGIQNEGLRQWLDERIELGKLTVYRYDGPARYLLGSFDETIGLVPIDETGVPIGLLQTENQAVREWIDQQFTEFQEEADEIQPGNVLG